MLATSRLKSVQSVAIAVFVSRSRILRERICSPYTQRDQKHSSAARMPVY
ncbi:hypothetical protein CEV34_5076 [Brucella pseudogrignonensis]|uniref:Uncharacterized protein n=1 Tax=Brucella pseudogrignonensis TaxID=419475 RepID=A0A256G2G4_9HYPH|nr:hypothetical protein CEV34_5076 [Brucella pseudogrignonensis]